MVVGIGFFLPILPLYLQARGGSPLLIGAVFAAGIVGRTAAQYPGGWLADRWGSKPVLVIATVAYALCFPLYLLPLAPGWLIAVRFLHALISGAYAPAAAAMVAGLALRNRGRAFGMLRASDMAGLFLGPMIGGLVAGIRLDAVFLTGALVALLAAPCLALLPATAEKTTEETEPVDWPRLFLVLVPALALAAPVQWTIGVYDSIWSLYLVHRGGNTLLVGVSFAAYSLPAVLLAGLSGGLADRYGRLRVAALSTAALGVFAALYPFLTSPWALIGLSTLEGGLTIGGGPAVQAMVSDAAPDGAQGRVQGAYQTLLNGATALGSVAAGGLYALDPGYPFFSGAILCVVGVGVAALRGRRVR